MLIRSADYIWSALLFGIILTSLQYYCPPGVVHSLHGAGSGDGLLLLRLTNRSHATYNVKEYNLIEGVR